MLKIWGGREMKMLLINALKGLRKKKIQMLGIVLMVMLATGIYTAMNTALDRIEDRYYNYLEEQKVEEFSLVPTINYKKDISIELLNDLKEKYFYNLNDSENNIIKNYERCIKNNNCGDVVISSISELFKKTGAYHEIAQTKIDEVAKKYNFTYDFEQAKVVKEKLYMHKFIAYDDKNLNKPYLVDGRFPSKDYEVTVLPLFAEANNLKIGDSYQILGETYKIVGFAYAPNHIYQVISLSVPFYDKKTNNILFTNKNTFDNVKGLLEENYVAKYNDKERLKLIFNRDDNRLKELENMFEVEKENIAFDASSSMRLIRVDLIQNELESNRIFAEAFLYLLLGISVFIIMVITKKRIDDERLQIGVLKSLGFNSFVIAASYLVYPFIGSIVGGLVGYLIGLSLNGAISNIFISFYAVPLDGFKVDLSYLASCVLIPLILLSSLSYLIALFMLRKKPLDLLKEGSNLKVNIFSRIINKVVVFLPFNYRFKYSLAFRSLGKLFVVSLTSFCTGMLIVLVLIGMNLFNSLIDQTFGKLNYNHVVNYYTPQIDGDVEDDLILSVSKEIIKVKDSTGKEKSLEEKIEVTLNGIDSEIKYLVITDEKENNLIPLISSDDNIVINESISKRGNIQVGDKVVISHNDEEIEYNVVGINKEYLGNNVYINRAELSKILGFTKVVYNQKYSNQEKYTDMNKISEEELAIISSVFSAKEMEENIKSQLQGQNTSVYIVIGFAGFMALVIIAVIANIVVEENRRIISLLKVMGYKNKDISSIVLNIYTPFVVIAYLVSIPVMIYILKIIVASLTGDIGIFIPIDLSYPLAAIGLLALLVAYYVAIGMSKRSLNKIPLSIALKRE